MPNIFTCQTDGKLCAGVTAAATPIEPLLSSSSSSSSTLSSFIENLHSSHVMTFQKFRAKTYLIININKKTISVSCVPVPVPASATVSPCVRHCLLAACVHAMLRINAVLFACVLCTLCFAPFVYLTLRCCYFQPVHCASFCYAQKRLSAIQNTHIQTTPSMASISIAAYVLMGIRYSGACTPICNAVKWYTIIFIGATKLSSKTNFFFM